MEHGINCTRKIAVIVVWLFNYAGLVFNGFKWSCDDAYCIDGLCAFKESWNLQCSAVVVALASYMSSITHYVYIAY